MIKYYIDKQRRLEKELAETKKAIESCVGGDVMCVLPDGMVMLENPPLGVKGKRIANSFYWYEFEIDGVKVAHFHNCKKGE